MSIVVIVPEDWRTSQVSQTLQPLADYETSFPFPPIPPWLLYYQISSMLPMDVLAYPSRAYYYYNIRFQIQLQPKEKKRSNN